MPVTKVKAPDGSVVSVQHPAGATQNEILSYAKQDHNKKVAAGVGETALTVASGLPAMVGGGVTGLATLATTQDPKAAAHVSQKVGQALTYRPRTDKGQQYTKNVADFVAPAAQAMEKAEKSLGNAALEATGSPLAATAAHPTPSVILEAMTGGLGYGAVRGGVRATRTAGDMTKRVANKTAAITDQATQRLAARFKNTWKREGSTYTTSRASCPPRP